MFGILAESDEACERGDDRSDPANVYADKQIGVVVCELRQKYSRGHIRDKLAGNSAEQKSARRKKLREKLPHGFYSRHISRKYKEEHKGQKQRIIYHFEGFSVKNHQNRGNYDKPRPVGYTAENDRYRKGEKKKIYDCSLYRQFEFFFLKAYRLGLYKYEAAEGYESDRKRKRRCHYQHKLACGDIELSVKIEVLRVAEGRQHSAEVCGNVLHYKSESHVFSLSRGAENEVAERQKGQQSHVVCNQHRPDKSDVDKRKHTHSRSFKALDDFLGENIEKVDVFERADHRQHAEKTGQGLEVKIFYILCVGLDDEACENRRAERCKHYGIFLDESSGRGKKLHKAHSKG